MLIAASIVSLLGMGMVNVANYPLSIHLGGGTEGYGALEALLGGGGLLGAAIAARMLSASRAPLIVTITFAVSGLGLLLAGLAPVLAVALAGMAIAGAGRGLGDVADTTLVQARTDDARRSRVFAAQDGAAHARRSSRGCACSRRRPDRDRRRTRRAEPRSSTRRGAVRGSRAIGSDRRARGCSAARRPGRSTSIRSDRTARTADIASPTGPSDPPEPAPRR